MLIDEALSCTAKGRRVEFHTWNEEEDEEEEEE